jgi:4-hydroxy-3-polyprenylbenzoate decarboxylase
MAYKSHRDYLEALEKNGEVVRIEKEVDWNLEAGAITRRCYEIRERSPLFLNIKDYPGFSMHGAPIGNYRRLAIAMGLDPDSSIKDISEEYERRMSSPIKPILVSNGPCKENIMKGDDVDLFKFPAPMVHDGDGGRYIATWHFIITKDIDSDWINWGMYRQMLHNRKYMGGLVLPGQDIGRMYQKYEKANKPMPFATVIGPDPLSAVASTASAGIGDSEADLAGGLREEPVELVKCETVDLYVPAHAEIIIEGYLLPKVRLEEGPFGEYTGYRTSPRIPRPVYEVTCITYRNNPIVPLANMGTPIDDCDILTSITWKSDAKKALSKLPVIDVHFPPEAISHMAVVSVHRAYGGIATHVADALWGSKLGYLTPYVVVVDSDVNIYDVGEVIHAIATKCHPVRGIKSRDNSPGHSLVPFLSKEERIYGRSAHALFDCTWPLEWSETDEIPERASFNSIYPKEIQEMILKNWNEYGF